MAGVGGRLRDAEGRAAAAAEGWLRGSGCGLLAMEDDARDRSY